MTLYSYVAPFSNSFEGNPNSSITAIDTSGGITCSRTSGKTPCIIQVSASGITASGTSRPFEDLDYSWDFGDVSSVETFTNPGVGGGTINTNDDQKGPRAAHCYRSAGDYTITLTIRGNRSSGHVLATVTQAITVTAFSASGGEYWADSTHGGTNAGTEANPFNTVTAIGVAIGSGTNKQVHVAKGSAFDGSVSLFLGVTAGLRIDTYGTGDIPSFNVSSGSANALNTNNAAARDDIVISGIRFSTSDSNTSASVARLMAVSGTNPITNIYLDNCEIHYGTDGGDNTALVFEGLSGSVSPLSKFGFWDCAFTSQATPTNTSTACYTKGESWFLCMAGSFEGGSLSHPQEHHLYANNQTHNLIAYVDFKTGAGRNFCINMNWNRLGGTTPEISQYHVITNCNLSGTLRAHDMGETNNNPAEVLHRNVVCQKNRIHALTGDNVIYGDNAHTYTHRDNEVWDCGASRYMALGTVSAPQIYRNKIYRNDIVGTGAMFSFNSASYTNLVTITDNIIHDLRAVSYITRIPFTQQAGATIDRNQYYAPNDSDSEYLYDLTTSKTFAEWQAEGFDTNGSVADPGWTDAANGDFS